MFSLLGDSIHNPTVRRCWAGWDRQARNFFSGGRRSQSRWHTFYEHLSNEDNEFGEISLYSTAIYYFQRRKNYNRVACLTQNLSRLLRPAMLREGELLAKWQYPVDGELLKGRDLIAA